MCDCTKCSITSEMKIEDLERAIELLKEQLERANKRNEIFDYNVSGMYWRHFSLKVEHVGKAPCLPTA